MSDYPTISKYPQSKYPAPHADGWLRDRVDALQAKVTELELENSELRERLRARPVDEQTTLATANNDYQQELMAERDMYKYSVAQMPQSCDGLEQPAFEEWASKSGYVMHEHPLHYIFLDSKTDAARDGWKAGLRYCNQIIQDAYEASKKTAV